VTLRRVAFALVLAGALGLIAALLLEGLVRVFQPQVLQRDVPDLWTPDPAIGWRHQPNKHVVANTGEREVDVCTDAIGDRVACDAPKPTNCAKRVLSIGDSYVEALAIPWNDLVWTKLDRDTGACTDVAGVSAYYPSQYVAVARTRLHDPATHYDLVVVTMYMGNDVVEDPDTIPPPQDVQRRPVRLFPAGLSLQDLWDWAYPFNSWLESHSQAYVGARFAIRRFMDPGDVGIYGVPDPLRPSRFTPALVEGTARAVDEIAREAHRAGARALVVVMPHRSQALDPDGAVLVRGLPKLAGDVDMNLSSTLLVPRLRETQVDSVVDLLPPLRARHDPELWGNKDAHLSPAGHQLWFESMREPVRELLAAPPPAPPPS
jgi:hypothetical protein